MGFTGRVVMRGDDYSHALPMDLESVEKFPYAAALCGRKPAESHWLREAESIYRDGRKPFCPACAEATRKESVGRVL